MASYDDPTLRVRLAETARNKVIRNHFGDKGYYDHQIGMTKIHLEQGLMFAQIAWGIDGMDSPVSPQVAEYIDLYEISFNRLPRCAAGIYTLRDKDKKKTPLARARIQDSRYAGENVSEILVTGEDRKDVVKLYSLIRDGRLRPDVEQEEFKQVEGALGELKRRRYQMAILDQKVTHRDSVIESLKGQLANVRHELAQAQTAAAK